MKESKMLLVVAAIATAVFGLAAIVTPDVHAQKGPQATRHLADAVAPATR